VFSEDNPYYHTAKNNFFHNSGDDGNSENRNIEWANNFIYNAIILDICEYLGVLCNGSGRLAVFFIQINANPPAAAHF